MVLSQLEMSVCQLVSQSTTLIQIEKFHKLLDALKFGTGIHSFDRG